MVYLDAVAVIELPVRRISHSRTVHAPNARSFSFLHDYKMRSPADYYVLQQRS
jgi:hypothetical protein